MVLQLESRLRDSLERLRLKEQNAAAARNSVGNSRPPEATLQQLLSTLQTQADRLATLESACSGAATGTDPRTRALLPGGGGAGVLEQEPRCRQAELDGLPVALAEVLRSWQQRNLPAGEMSRSVSSPPAPAWSQGPAASSC